MTRILALAGALLLTASLSACGLTGDLQRPGPLIGTPSRDVPPADLPEGEDRDLPELPQRPQGQNQPADDDELLGGPGGS